MLVPMLRPLTHHCQVHHRGRLQLLSRDVDVTNTLAAICLTSMRHRARLQSMRPSHSCPSGTLRRASTRRWCPGRSWALTPSRMRGRAACQKWTAALTTMKAYLHSRGSRSVAPLPTQRSLTTLPCSMTAVALAYNGSKLVFFAS